MTTPSRRISAGGHRAGQWTRPTPGSATEDRGGYWVAIEELNAQAQQVIDSVKAAVSTVRAARYVVVDCMATAAATIYTAACSPI